MNGAELADQFRDDRDAIDSDDRSSWLVDSKRAAALLGISTRSVFELHATGKLKSLTIGRRRLFDVSDIREFIERAKRNGGR